MPVNYITDFYLLERNLKSSDSYTQMGKSFLCQREGSYAVFIWSGQIPEKLRQQLAVSKAS